MKRTIVPIKFVFDKKNKNIDCILLPFPLENYWYAKML